MPGINQTPRGPVLFMPTKSPGIHLIHEHIKELHMTLEEAAPKMNYYSKEVLSGK